MKYSPEIVEKICGYLRDGRTQKDAAALAGIAEDTFYEWMNTKTEFSEWVRIAQDEYWKRFDKELVSTCKRSLLELANGYECEEVTTEYISDKKGNPVIKTQKRVVKKYKPDVTAIQFALTNKAPDEFKNRQYQEGKMTQEIVNKPDLSTIPDELLDQVLNALDEQTTSSNDSAQV